MGAQIQLGEIRAEVVLKEIKNIHLSVYPPAGRVRIAAPLRMDLDTIRVFALSKLPWIRRQQEKLRGQEREAPRDCIDRESHTFRGRRYLLKIVEHDAAPAIELKHGTMLLRVRPGTGKAGRQAVIDEWYRRRLKEEIAPLIAEWEKTLGVRAGRVRVQKMKTRWGSCNPLTRSILINLELAKKPGECLGYIVVHELAHLREPKHNDRFIALMDRHLPRWRFIRDELNRLPVRHERWEY